MARAIHEAGMAESVRLLLTGTGVRCLERDDESCSELNECLMRVLEAEVPTAACTKSLDEHGLLDEVEGIEDIEPVGSPVYLSSRVDDGYAMLTF